MFDSIRSDVRRWAISAMVVLVAACGKFEQSAYQPGIAPMGQPQGVEYVVGVYPLHNPQRLMELYGPIVDYLDGNMPEVHFRLEASRNYEEFEKRLYAGHYAFAMLNSYQTVRSLKHGYRVFGKMGDAEVFRGIILVRKDSGIREPADLKGKAVAYPAATALGATLMPQYFLHSHGIDVNRDIDNRYVGSQESSIMNVLRGHVAAGATWTVPWNSFSAAHPELASQLEVKWQTEPLLNNGWVVRNDVPAPIAEKFARLLFGLQDSAQGKAMLGRLPISRFEPATDATYRPVRDFLEQFSGTVRRIEH